MRMNRNQITCPGPWPLGNWDELFIFLILDWIQQQLAGTHRLEPGGGQK